MDTASAMPIISMNRKSIPPPGTTAAWQTETTTANRKMTSTSTTTVTPSTISVKGPRALHSWMIAIAEAGERATAEDAQKGCDGHHLGHRSAVQKRQQRPGGQHECRDAERHDDRLEQDGQRDAPSPLPQLLESQFAARGQGDEGQGQVVDELQLLDRSGVDELECVGSEEDPGQDVSGDLRNLEVREDISEEVGGQQQETEGHGRPGVRENGGIAGAEERQHHEEDDDDQPEDADHDVISRAVRSTLFASEGLSSSFRITASNTVVTTALVSSVELSW